MFMGGLFRKASGHSQKTLKEVLIMKRNLQKFNDPVDNGNEFYVEMDEFVTPPIEKHIRETWPTTKMSQLSVLHQPLHAAMMLSVLHLFMWHRLKK